MLAGIAATSAGHYLTPQDLMLWHNIFQRLYYLPIVYAAVSFGWLGGLAAAGLSALAYLPHILVHWAHSPSYSINQYAEIVVFLLVGGITGVLADRERKREAQLRSAFAQLQRADRLSAIGQLSAGLAHEIRNPLASIEGAAEIVEEASSPEEIREFRAIILKECQRLNRLLSSLLDFARPRPPELREVDMDRVLDAVLQLVGRSAGKSGITIRKEVDAALPRVVGDSEQITQVVLNLALNAVQAMPEGGEAVLAARLRDGAVSVEVKDSGVGIPQQDLEKIFDPFYTTKPDGTGLGLSVVHQIVTQHGGSVSARRNPEGGMTFALKFPAPKR